jgi:hypothetical protein
MLKTDPHRAKIFFLNLYIILLFYNVGLAIFKYSFLALYIRLFRVSTRLRYSCYVLGVLITMWWIACVFAIGFRCTPVQASWDPTAGKCIPMKPIFLGQAIPTIVFDIIILLLPVRLVWAIQMPRPAKIAVLMVFVSGGLVAVISFVRFWVVLHTTEADVPCRFMSRYVRRGSKQIRLLTWTPQGTIPLLDYGLLENQSQVLYAAHYQHTRLSSEDSSQNLRSVGQTCRKKPAETSPRAQFHYFPTPFAQVATNTQARIRTRLSSQRRDLEMGVLRPA